MNLVHGDACSALSVASSCALGDSKPSAIRAPKTPIAMTTPTTTTMVRAEDPAASRGVYGPRAESGTGSSSERYSIVNRPYSGRGRLASARPEFSPDGPCQLRAKRYTVLEANRSPGRSTVVGNGRVVETVGVMLPLQTHCAPPRERSAGEEIVELQPRLGGQHGHDEPAGREGRSQRRRGAAAR